jgi:hypothetical protein
MEQNNQQKAGEDDEDDDYMAMVIEEPKGQRETYAQKKMRLQREVCHPPHAYPHYLCPNLVFYNPFGLFSVVQHRPEKPGSKSTNFDVCLYSSPN